jgi:putative transcriptional regulator
VGSAHGPTLRAPPIGSTLIALTVLALLAVPVDHACGASGDPMRPARGRLLVASRDLVEPNFAQAVVLILEYDAAGAMGVVINRPTRRRLDDLGPRVQTERRDAIYLGGPVLVSSLLVVLRTREPPSTGMRVFDDVFLLTSRSAVDDVLATKLPQDRLRFYAGHAGWGPGQLDAELLRGDWHVTTATPDVVFADAPDRVWQREIARTDGEWTRIPDFRSRVRMSAARPSGTTMSASRRCFPDAQAVPSCGIEPARPCHSSRTSS